MTIQPLRNQTIYSTLHSQTRNSVVETNFPGPNRTHSNRETNQILSETANQVSNHRSYNFSRQLGVQFRPDVSSEVNQIRDLMDGHTNEREENQIRNIILEASPRELSGIIDQIGVENLEDELDPHDLTAIMAQLALSPEIGNNAEHFKNLMNEIDLEASQSLLAGLRDEELTALADTPAGRQALESRPRERSWGHMKIPGRGEVYIPESQGRAIQTPLDNRIDAILRETGIVRIN